MGFKTIGRPKRTSSLIPKIPGTIASFPIVCICFDLLLSIKNTKPKVAPPPPIATKLK